MEWEEHFDNGTDMVAGAKARIEGEDKPIRYINGRYKLVGEAESRWLFNIAYRVDGDDLVIVEKLRPFYFAACIGFKAFVFYNNQAC